MADAPRHADPASPGIADLVAVAAQVERDADRPSGALWRRDREIGREFAHLKGRPERQLTTWADRVAEEPYAAAARTRTALRLTGLALTLAGVALGWAVAAAVFYYNGEHPVNVVNVLAVLVGLQVLLLVPFVVGALRRDLAWFSPARLATLPLRLFPQELRDRLAAFVGAAEAHGKVYGRVQKWALLRWSQLFAVAFNLGVLARFLQLVFFSDLAFAWSTTLRVEAEDVHRITSALASPWAWALRDAEPSAELVRSTQYFRMEGVGAGEAVDAAQFGGWWPFILMCLLVYALLPRVVTLALSHAKLRESVAWTMRHTPGAAAVLDRLNNEYVETRAVAPVDNASEASGDDATPVSAAPKGSTRFVINWAHVPLDAAAVEKAAGAARVYECGGARTLDEDRETIRIAVASSGDGGVLVIAKAWEPPMLEVVDFLADLRGAVGSGVPITVLPVGVESGEAVPADAAHLTQWRRRVATAGDPWASVATLPGRVAAA